MSTEIEINLLRLSTADIINNETEKNATPRHYISLFKILYTQDKSSRAWTNFAWSLFYGISEKKAWRLCENLLKNLVNHTFSVYSYNVLRQFVGLPTHPNKSVLTQIFLAKSGQKPVWSERPDITGKTRISPGVSFTFRFFSHFLCFAEFLII